MHACNPIVAEAVTRVQSFGKPYELEINDVSWADNGPKFVYLPLISISLINGDICSSEGNTALRTGINLVIRSMLIIQQYLVGYLYMRLTTR